MSRWAKERMTRSGGVCGVADPAFVTLRNSFGDSPLVVYHPHRKRSDDARSVLDQSPIGI